MAGRRHVGKSGRPSCVPPESVSSVRGSSASTPSTRGRRRLGCSGSACSSSASGNGWSGSGWNGSGWNGSASAWSGSAGRSRSASSGSARSCGTSRSSCATSRSGGRCSGGPTTLGGKAPGPGRGDGALLLTLKEPPRSCPP